MKAYFIDLREKIVKAYLQGDTSIRKVAQRFGVAIQGKLAGYESQLAAMVEQNPDATLSEYCEYWGETYGNWLSISTMCRALQKQKLTLKKDLTE